MKLISHLLRALGVMAMAQPFLSWAEIPCCCASSHDSAPSLALRHGDLLFVSDADSDFSNAIIDATAGAQLSFDHVAIFAIVNGDSLVVDATPSRGVAITSLSQFVGEHRHVCAATIDSIDVAAAVDRAIACVGKEYDWEFASDNDKLYCSELIQVSYLCADGTPYFQSIPMNFKNAEGDFSPFWIELFQRLGRPIPQGEPGTNPNSLYMMRNLKLRTK